jgi:hypothetical protein
MTVSLKHAFTSAKSDGTDSTLVQPSNWNAEHVLSFATGKLLGNGSGSAGSQEITPSSNFSLTSGAIDLASGIAVGTVQTSSSTSTTPVLSFNASNSPTASGATISGSYLQSMMQNKSGTAGASTNYVLSNDLGTDSSYYGEFGMNSSVFSSSTPADFFSINNGIYFSGHDGDIAVGSGNGFKFYIPWGSTGASAHVINSSGAIGFSTNLGTTPATSGTTGFGTSGQFLVSAGSAAAPAWGSSIPTLAVTHNAYASIVALTDAATIAVDMSATGGNNFSVTLAGNRTLGNPTGLTAGQSGIIYVTQDATGSRTLAYSSYWKFPGGTAPTLTTTANAVDALVYTVRTSTSITVQSVLNIA